MRGTVHTSGDGPSAGASIDHRVCCRLDPQRLVHQLQWAAEAKQYFPAQLLDPGQISVGSIVFYNAAPLLMEESALELALGGLGVSR